MSKPLQYYASGEHLEKLCERFGQELELLDRNQKLELRIILSFYVWGQDDSDGYGIFDAYNDSIQHLLVEDSELEECLEILQGISVQDAESLQLALLEQCRIGNARLKTPLETQTEDLKTHGIPEDLAKQAAYILVKVDPVRQRTAEEQELITKVHQILMGMTQPAS
ncbi:hypothetical protein F7734_39035 [Scytonema sp. UIC 10036]|uniref:hypothetical protein n=1 Tax=Scytonema sp. UIC 10036 TaxID=2304196 RepID=UPI0012DACD65|nr:hypothetical protein [Scytonema sp. UIC 10036]MUG97987.1 hypothetical protein [Scytonema sp. UIC 10036]